LPVDGGNVKLRAYVQRWKLRVCERDVDGQVDDPQLMDNIDEQTVCRRRANDCY